MQMLCDGVPIQFKLDDNEKKSMLVVGGSRMGKTFFVSNLSVVLANQGYGIHLIDLGEKWSYLDKQRLQSAGAVTKEVASQEIVFVFQTDNDLCGCGKIIANALGFRSMNATIILKDTFQKLARKLNGFNMRDVIRFLKANIDKFQDEWCLKILERIDCCIEIPRIRFCISDNNTFLDANIIWELSGLDEEYVHMTAYLILYNLLCWKKVCFKENSKKDDTFVIVDEFQNLDCDRKSIVGKCLTEGQKYGVNLILITQFLRGNFSEAVVNQFKQGGFRFYFRLTEEEAAILSRQLVYGAVSQKGVFEKLSKLPIGHCLMLGPHSLGKRTDISEKMRFVTVEYGMGE